MVQQSLSSYNGQITTVAESAQPEQAPTDPLNHQAEAGVRPSPGMEGGSDQTQRPQLPDLDQNVARKSWGFNKGFKNVSKRKSYLGLGRRSCFLLFAFSCFLDFFCFCERTHSTVRCTTATWMRGGKKLK